MFLSHDHDSGCLMVNSDHESYFLDIIVYMASCCVAVWIGSGHVPRIVNHYTSCQTCVLTSTMGSLWGI